MKRYEVVLVILILSVMFFSKASLSPALAATPSFTLDFGKEQTVFDWPTQAIACGDSSAETNGDKWVIPDSPARALVDAAGNVQLYAAYDINRKAMGPNLNDVQFSCHIIMNSDKDPNPRAYNGFEWMESPYTLDGNVIYGLMHTEFHGNLVTPKNCNTDQTNPYTWTNCWWNSVNLAVSTDGGNTYTHAAPPNQNVSNTSVDFNPDNINGLTGILGPSNIVKFGSFYYSVVTVRTPPYQQINQDTRRDAYEGGCTMRTDNLADPSSWHYWNGTDWNTPARGIPGTGNPPPNRCADTFLDSGSIYQSTYLGKLLSIFYIPVPNAFSTTNNVYIQTSSDLAHVDKPDAAFSYNPSKYSVYYSLLQPGAETRNFEDIGRSPWLYFSACGGPDCSWDNPNPGGHDISLKRVRVRFNKPEDVGKYDVLDLHFNEYIGTKTLDSSFYGNDGTLSGGATLQGLNKYIHFDGTGKVTVNQDSSLDRSGDISITTRIRTTQSPPANTFPVIVQKQLSAARNYGFYLLSSGQIHFSTGHGGQYFGSVSNTAINDGRWHDIEVNFSSTTGVAQFIIDGRSDKTVTQGGNIADGINTNSLEVGTGFQGDLDHLTIYNYLLPAPGGQPGDFTGDGHVTLDDYNLVKNNFGHPYTIFDYNQVAANFGR